MKQLALISLLFLGACTTTKQLEVTSTPAPIIISHPTDPRPVTLSDVQFTVINNENVDSFIQSIKKDPTIVYIVITTKDYEKIALNLQELRRYIKQQKEIILYYRKVTTNGTPTN